MQEIDFVVMTTSFGGRDISNIREAVPNLIVCTDYNHDPMGNFLNSLSITDNPSVHFEDDIELCNDFYSKVCAAINQYPDNVINFFSLREKDYQLQMPYFERGGSYLMNQCFYLPRGFGKKIVEFYDSWENKAVHPTGLDVLIADYLKANKLRYVQWFPHLVNHTHSKSLINPKRSSGRIDKKFIK